MSKKMKSYSAKFRTKMVLELLREEENETLAKTLGKTTIERDGPPSCGVVATLGRVVGKLKSLDLSNKRRLVESKRDTLCVTRQCQLLALNRSTHYYKPVPVSQHDLKLMRRIDEIYTDISCFYGYRRIHAQLKVEGWRVGHNKVFRLMGHMGIEGQRPKRRKSTSIKAKEHKIHPYLLKQFNNEEKQVVTTAANEIWSGDITSIPIKGGFKYLAAIIDWHSRALLAHRLSNTMDESLVTDVLEEAIARHGKPKIFNSDQGCRPSVATTPHEGGQYTSKAHTGLLEKYGISISMNGKGRSIDNIAIECFFRTLKYEEVYVNEYHTIKELKAGIKQFIDFYNFNRLHSALKYDKPMNVHMSRSNKAA